MWPGNSQSRVHIGPWLHAHAGMLIMTQQLLDLRESFQTGHLYIRGGERKTEIRPPGGERTMRRSRRKRRGAFLIHSSLSNCLTGEDENEMTWCYWVMRHNGDKESRRMTSVSSIWLLILMGRCNAVLISMIGGIIQTGRSYRAVTQRGEKKTGMEMKWHKTGKESWGV